MRGGGDGGDGDAFIFRKQFVVDALLLVVMSMVLVEVVIVLVVMVYSGSSLWCMC